MIFYCDSLHCTFRPRNFYLTWKVIEWSDLGESDRIISLGVLNPSWSYIQENRNNVTTTTASPSTSFKGEDIRPKNKCKMIDNHTKSATRPTIGWRKYEKKPTKIEFLSAPFLAKISVTSLAPLKTRNFQGRCYKLFFWCQLWTQDILLWLLFRLVAS